MVAFLLEHRQTIGIGLLAVWALMQFSGSLGGFVTRLRGMLPFAVPTSPSPPAQPEVDPLPVIRKLKKRFKGNAEAVAALKVIWSCLLEDEAT